MSLGEFDLISRYFAPLSSKESPAFGLSDDAAVFSPTSGHDLVFTKDALVADVHFNADDPADLIAQKAMRVNLSDLAAMGAVPVGYLVALSLPRNRVDIEEWVKNFATGLKKGQAEFKWTLLGGDTVATTGPLTLSLTAIGEVVHGQALRRKGAGIGDDIYVSGTLGDSALGLKSLQGEILPQNPYLVKQYHLPQPRLTLGQQLYGIVTSCLDISDGLAGDIGHICKLSGLGATIEANLLPLSPETSKVLESNPSYKSLLWNGGDDYELLFTAPDHMADKVKKLSEKLELPLTKIGYMTAERTIKILDESGKNLLIGHQGYRHF